MFKTRQLSVFYGLKDFQARKLIKGVEIFIFFAIMVVKKSKERI